MNVLNHVLEELRILLAQCAGQLTKLVELGYDETTLEREFAKHRELTKKLERAPANGTTLDRARELLASGARLFKVLETYEYKYLISYQANNDLWFWVNELEVAHRQDADERYQEWDKLRMKHNVPIADVRIAYATVLQTIEDAERSAAEIRISQTFAPEPSKKSYAKNRRFNTGPKKGSTAEIPNIGGSSRKARYQKRRQGRVAKAS